MKYWIGVLQVVAAGICFGFLGIFARLGYQHGLSVGEILSFRFALATTVLFVGLVLSKPQLLRLSMKQIFVSLLLGACGYASFSTLYFMAIRDMSVPLAAMLLFTFPMFVNIGSHFFLREKLVRGQVVCLLLASLGMVLLLWGDVSVRHYSAVLYALTAAVAYAAYVLISGKVQRQVPPLSSSLYVMLAASLALFCFHRPSLPVALHYSFTQWSILLSIAVVSTIAPLSLFLAGLQKMPSSKAAILVMIEPVTASLAATLLLHEVLLPVQIAGAILVVGAVVCDAIFR